MKITKKWAREALKAVDILIERYKRGEESVDGMRCPFCISFHNIGAVNECEKCPWFIFKGYSCDDAEFGAYDDILIPQRLPRLYGWRKRLTNIIERGK